MHMCIQIRKLSCCHRRFGERGDMNQYWYSASTLEAMVAEVEQKAKRVAFLSTPSVYFSLKKVTRHTFAAPDVVSPLQQPCILMSSMPRIAGLTLRS